MTDPAPRQTILHVFPSFEVGGSQMRFVTLAKRLAARYRHVILAMNNRHEAASLLDATVDFALQPYALDKRFSLANLVAYRRIIRDSGAARLITYNWGATEWGLANLLGGIPHIHIEDGFGPEETRRQIPRRVWFRRLALARARPIALPSRTLEKIALEQWRFPRSQIAYIPNGVDCDRFARPPDQSLCASLGLDGRVPVIGTVAGLRPEKNVGRLIRAFARVHAQCAVRLVIVGTGPEREALMSLAQSLGIAADVTFAGQMAEVERILGAFAIYAISSDTEQMPISLIEAMAASLPVAAVNVGDIASMVATENRPFVTPVGDEPLASAIAALLADPERCRRIGAANAVRARSDFAESTMIAAYDALYSGRPLPA
jgi:glycosyltransferase involved in cell wall biosynthesis